MATTQYQVLYRYFNTDMNRCITNLTKEEWTSATDTKVSNSKEVFEFYTGKSSEDQPMTEQQKFAETQRLQNLIIEGNKATNPKFDMFFIYDGRNVIYSNKNGDFPYVLADHMKRILVSPWFVSSTHGSLEAAMTRAKALIKKIGVDNVRVGKVIPLEQYIEIV